MSPSDRGQSLELYFINGKPDGMLTAEVFNWTGHVLLSPRLQIQDALRRKEAGFTGVYCLIGEKEDGNFAYVGEGEDMSERIRSHVAHKDWWTKVVFMTSQANSLNKAHIRYLEARLVEIARDVGTSHLENSSIPARPSLKESELANIEGFLDYLLMVLPAIGVDTFKKTARDDIGSESRGRADTPYFRLENRKHGIKARAVVDGGEFVVLKGSEARLTWSDASPGATYSGLHAELKTMGILSPSGSHLVFDRHFAFSSPSAAAAVVNGRPSNGTVEWKLEKGGMTYKQWEAEHISDG